MSVLGFDAPATTNTDATVTLPDTRRPRALSVLYSLDVDPLTPTRFVVLLDDVEQDFHYVTKKDPFPYEYRHWLPGQGELKFRLEAAIGCKGTVKVEHSKR